VKILILAVHYEVTGARYIADAFKRLGHDVKHYGIYAQLKDAWGVAVDPKYKWHPASFMELDQWCKPDLVIIADTEDRSRVPHAFIKDVPVVVWSQDNHVRNMRHIAAAHYFLAHAHGPAQPVTYPDETWLPCGFDPTVFTPSQIPWEERIWDVAMLGVMYPRRQELANRLLKAGFKVYAETGLVYEDYAAVYQNARISLCVSAAGDIAQRFFETAAMGCTVLTDLLLDLTDSETNRKLGLSGFAVYQDDDDCVTMVQDLLGPNRELAMYGARQLQKIVCEQHTWDARAQVVVDWYQTNYGGKVAGIILNEDGTVKDTPLNLGKTLPDGTSFSVGDVNEPNALNNKPLKVNAYLNLGCGKTHFPSAKPLGHELVGDDLYTYPLWVNVDKVEGVGADKTFDLFTYPWPLEDNSFDGALLAHIVEHIPHEIRLSSLAISFNNKEDEDGNADILTPRAQELEKLQDGWYAFWSELYRVLTPGALVHIVSPYGFSDGGITDPSHTRYLTMNTFTHSMTPEISDGSTFQYNNGGINFVIDGNPQYRMTPFAIKLQERTGFDMDMLLGIYLNVCYDFYLKLKVVK
jgi:hypothetical protein